MSLERKDKVAEQTTTTGTGTVDLNGVAPLGFRSFAGAGVSNGATVRYLIENEDKTEWEVGEGIFTDASPDTLSRVTVYASSNAGSLVDFSAGTKIAYLVLTAQDISALYALPDGTLWNGKIVPSVSSNNLTLALKTKAGNDPSLSDPVYVMINGTLRIITSALSVTKNAGTNWFAAGSSELATKEIDYFVYLGYNATDGVVIGFSRIPYATLYSDFSATTTNEKYCAISTITNATAGDDYVNIGRFAATLSAGAGYTWSVPTYTTKNLIQRPIFETRWLSWQPTVGGFSSAPTHAGSRYIIRNRSCYVFSANGNSGTSNANTYTLSAPIGSDSGYTYQFPVLMASDNSSVDTAAIYAGITNGETTIKLYINDSSSGWTTSGTKYAKIAGEYQIA